MQERRRRQGTRRRRREDASTALHAAGDALHDENRDAFARYAEQAAGQVEQFTSAIRDRSVGEILDEAERFARREPGLFIGGAFLLGIAGARFLKASDSGSANGSPASTGRSTSTASRAATSTPPARSAGGPRPGAPFDPSSGGAVMGGETATVPAPATAADRSDNPLAS